MLAWCKDSVKYSVAMCFTVSISGARLHPEVHVPTDSIKLFKNVDKSDTFQKLLDLVLMCMVLARCVCD